MTVKKRFLTRILMAAFAIALAGQVFAPAHLHAEDPAVIEASALADRTLAALENFERGFKKKNFVDAEAELERCAAVLLAFNRLASEMRVSGKIEEATREELRIGWGLALAEDKIRALRGNLSTQAQTGFAHGFDLAARAREHRKQKKRVLNGILTS